VLTNPDCFSVGSVFCFGSGELIPQAQILFRHCLKICNGECGAETTADPAVLKTMKYKPVLSSANNLPHIPHDKVPKENYNITPKRKKIMHMVLSMNTES